MTGPENAPRHTRVGHDKADSTDTYIGRGPDGRHLNNTPIGKRGWLGNPYHLQDGYDRTESIENYREDFYARVRDDRDFRDAVHELAGDTLGGWCRRLDEDEPACHGDVIAEYLNNPEVRERVHG